MTLIDGIRKILVTPTPQAVTAKTAVWWGLSLAIALLFGVLALHDGFSTDRLVQDDARQYVFWMQRFQEPDLFPNDLIADYFQSVTPLGYITLYRGGALLGIEPFTFNKLLPIGLGLVTTSYFFWLVMAMIPLPVTAFLASLFLNQTLWMKDDLVSATPRAFIYPFFIAFLYYLSQHQKTRKSLVPNSSDRGMNLVFGAGAIALLGFFYPQYVLVAGGVVLFSLVRWRHGRLTLSNNQRAWMRTGVYLTVIVGVIAFYGLTASDYAPIVTVEQAETMPEFWPGGRNFFFSENLWWFYWVGDRSGFFHVGLVRPATLCLGVFLPIMLWQSPQNPVLQHRTSALSLLLQLLLAAMGLFVLAHLLLFQLHLPSRYTDHSLRIIMAIAASLAVTVTLEFLLRVGCMQPYIGLEFTQRSRQVPQQPSWMGRAHKALFSQKINLIHPVKQGVALGTALLLSTLVVIYPVFVEDFPLTKYKQGNAPRLYEFFKAQSIDSLVASVAEEVNNIPVFAQRSILVGREYAIPYHLGFYNVFHDRVVDLIRAQYSADPAVAIAFIQTYGIDYWIIDEKAYEPDYIADNWTRQYLPDVGNVVSAAIQGESPAIIQGIQSCAVAQQKPLTVLDTTCLIETLQ